jgi:hypothetical protein
MSDMLSHLCLGFQDSDLLDIYQREKAEFYSKALPILTIMMLLLTGTLEIYYRWMEGNGVLSFYISYVNGSASVVLLLITCLHNRCKFLHTVVCPCLTVLVFAYLSFVDYDFTLGSIYYSLIIGFTLAYFILVVFNERWLISTFFFAPSLTWYMYKTGRDLLGAEWQELIMRSVFCTLIYAIVAYRAEVLTK